MQEQDLDAVFHVQTQAYVPQMVESMVLLRERLQVAANCCWVACDALGAGAYLMSYPSVSGKISRLGESFWVAAMPDTLYLHDVAVGQRLAGKGIGVALIQQALQYARQQGWRHVGLVSVQDTLAFWQKQGFSVCEGPPPGQEVALQTYSGVAYYCERKLDFPD
ncbi:GNAT family N-acetyltransferase [Undibacterium oligocarboniphilum]|uniref:GNAT family N-acetyltransferase n=1 Tax=Undibacterium oligocarboniphilum TaxID=666702 RepID=A0A850QE96_9BURK|nr:GNAT family N-acetyltransferase [Undibacterium oligocarboniphilum]MBC3869522.1 GNAT family N-acetyltransferase [Undibacterium oligocarboniphilum]NVO77901.1 GNAT family N-acetyltransferase [Undibacterium oligocarboniphilum]